MTGDSALHYRYVGCCPFCSWIGGQCVSPVPAAYQAAHHSETIHADREGVVGYIRKIHVKKLMTPDIPMKRGISKRRRARRRRG